MQTFLPFEDFALSAAALHYKHLGKQRLECKQILNAMHMGGGWKNHPAVRMWRGHTHYLLKYYEAIANEWISRGYDHKMTLDAIFYVKAREELEKPPWLGHEHFHRCHRFALATKKPDHYIPLFDDVIAELLPGVWYDWPVSKTGELTPMYRKYEEPVLHPMVLAPRVPF